MYTAFAYGLWIQSERLLLDPVEPIHPLEVNQPDVVVSFSSLSEASVPANQGNEIFVGLPWGLKLWIRSGCEVVVDAPPDVDWAVIRGYILGAAMACILRQRGYLVLHASGVAKDNRAIAFLGGSGWGKSTLASLFHQHGYSLLTDDVMAIQIGNVSVKGSHNPSLQVVPSFPEVRLLPDAAAFVGTETEGFPMLQSLSHKQVQRLDQQFAAHPVPLTHLYILRVGDEQAITPASGALAFTELIQHSRATKTLADQAFMVQHFHQCSALAKAVPMSYLQRPRSLDQLPGLVKFIEAHLTEAHPMDGDLQEPEPFPLGDR